MRKYDLEPTLQRIARSDAVGIPLVGRSAEIAALRLVGARNPSLGRIFEGHVNGAQLVARFGSPEQHRSSDDAIVGGHVFGVWNTQDDAHALRLHRCGDDVVLSGGKTWASGAGSISRPLVTAVWPDGGLQLCLLRMDESHARVDKSAWRPLGMNESDSFNVDFTGLKLRKADLIGRPGDYECQPWFFGGALRFAAVQTGIVERLFDETVTYVRERRRDEDAMMRARVAEMRIAVRTAELWLDAGAAAWQRFDAEPSERNAAGVLDVVDMARTAIERSALDTIERAVRSVGAHGLVEPFPFAGLVRDLQMYLRQPAPDAALARVGRAAFIAREPAANVPAPTSPMWQKCDF